MENIPSPAAGSPLWRAFGELDQALAAAWTVVPLSLLLTVAALVLLATVAVRFWLRARRRMAEQAERMALEARIIDANRALDGELAELRGRLAAMADVQSSRQAELAASVSAGEVRLTEALSQRLDTVSARLGDGLTQVSQRLTDTVDGVSQRLGANLADATQRLGSSLADTQSRNAESLSRLYERLAVLDQAGANLAELSGQVVSLKDVLANKQARGAFGQVRMEAIIEDGLPRGAYKFQPTLSNGKRPDCLVHLPSAPTPLVIDAKFPLEGFESLRLARTAEEIAAASARVREAIGKHVDDIAGKYLIPGETQDMALMFVPSESVYAELHERFADMIQRAHRSRVVVVSPNILMLAVGTMQAILKDVRMREQAGLIQREVGLLMGDVGRLAERVRDLEKHFTLAAKDVEKILTSTEQIARRGSRIETVDLEDKLAPALVDEHTTTTPARKVALG